MKKSSIKLLITLCGVLIGFLVTGLFILRSDIKEIIAELELGNKYRTVEVERFSGLVFSENWSVRISPGIQRKVEVEFDEEKYMPIIENIDGVLHFNIQSQNAEPYTKIVKARISTPFLYSIKASKGTKVLLEKFDSDSLSVEIGDQGLFTSKQNKFDYMSFKTSGRVGIELFQNPFD
jgi:hypothetical protein